jgi:uncharacterized zinc-type alcohol dehydrogenase-like protein
MTTTAQAYGSASPSSKLAPLQIARRAPGPTDVQMEILFCGVCHSDVHTARGEWPGTNYACVPGHEIVGRVTAVGTKVTKLKVGDIGATGCMVDSCRTCPSCQKGLEQFCLTGATFTYNSPDKHLGGHTFGGYSFAIVVDEAFTLRVPQGMDLAATAPLLCAGITTYSPLRHWKVGPGQKVGIVGLGGLGHMGVKLARAFGAHVVLFTTSPSKVADGLRLGAHEVVVSTDAAAMAKHACSLDFILDCVSAQHDLNAYLSLLRVDGTLCLVGVPEQPLAVHAFSVIMPRRNFSGSCIGGIAETQEMLEFCAQHGIVSDIELIPIQKINEAWDRMIKQDVRYRFVIDMASLKQA